MHLNSHKVGLALGAFAGLVHLAWSVLVALNWAQPFIDFVFNLHMINPPYTVGQFSLGTAIFLVIVTSIAGFIFGSVFATIWNRLHKA